ncbi:MAG: DMT family transporter [Chloroflexota bacterium]|nr:DMT family transporter [Chloroflexota bacterium]
MENLILVLIVGLAGGVAVGLQAPLTSLMSGRLGTLESVFIVHLGGAILAGLPLLVMRGGNLGAWRDVPWYALAAGSLGLVVLSAVSYTIPRIGVATTVTLIVVAQLVTAALLDHFGLLGATVRVLDPARLLGIAVLFAGTWLIMR